MSDSTYSAVCNTLAAYFDVLPSEIRPDQQLRRDWGLDSLELNVVALRIEQLEDVEIRSSDLETVHTVGQLILLVRAIRRRSELADELTAVRSRRGADMRRGERFRVRAPEAATLLLEDAPTTIAMRSATRH
jgi:acyl carrier protein